MRLSICQLRYLSTNTGKGHSLSLASQESKTPAFSISLSPILLPDSREGGGSREKGVPALGILSLSPQRGSAFLKTASPRVVSRAPSGLGWEPPPRGAQRCAHPNTHNGLTLMGERPSPRWSWRRHRTAFPSLRTRTNLGSAETTDEQKDHLRCHHSKTHVFVF